MAKLTESTSRWLLENVDIRYGPVDLFSTFILQAVDQTTTSGLRLEFGTLRDLVAVNEENRDSWLPLTTTFRVDVGGIVDEHAIVLLGRDIDGKIMAAQAMRLFDWRATDFKAEAESLRFFYADPERSRAAGELCVITDTYKHKISGRVALSGATWFHPNIRGNGLAETIPRLARVLAFARWNFDYVFATVNLPNVSSRYKLRTGYNEVMPGAVIMRKSPTSPNEDPVLTLSRQDPMTLVNDAFSYVMRGIEKVDAGVRKRRA